MTKISQATFLRGVSATIALGTALTASPLLAQATPADVQAAAGNTTATAATEPTNEAGTSDADSQEAIVVTGSRIASPTITSVSPVQVIGAQAIQQSGITNVQELLLENPAFGTPTFARTNTAFATSGTGIASVDLRNLGTDRTLVLINGRRVVAGVPGSVTVDLNVIPAQFLQRVDVLTGGASSLYGSDAVAGVVNFILKDDFEGIEANGQYNITERGDTPGYQANVTAGGNFADDRGNIMVHMGYTFEGELLSRQRRNTQVDDVDAYLLGPASDPSSYGTPFVGQFSGLPPQGVFTAGDNPLTTANEGRQFTFSPSNTLECGFDADGLLSNFSGPATLTGAAATRCGVPSGTVLPARGFNRQAFRTIAVPVKRYLFAARTKYDISDELRFFAEGTYSRTTAKRQIEPFGISTAGSTGIYPAGGLMPIETRVNGVAVLNPFVPAGIAAVATDQDGDGLRDIAFSRRLLEFGTRNSSTVRNFYRFVVGLEGDIFDDKFHWDVSYNFGSTRESQEGNGQVNIQNFRDALAVVPAGTISGTVGPQCADAQARANGCVPVNVFGNNSISPGAISFIQANQTFQTSIQQQVVQANLSGSLFELPAGPLGIAIGAEYRKEKSSENSDSLTNQGLNGGNAIPDTAGQFDVKEIYGEINVPILADVPFFKQLNLRGAGRISDYSTVGKIYTYSGGVEWTPIQDLRFTGTYARAVRAPNIGELFQGPAQTFPTGLTDPCVGVTATTAGTLGDTCRAGVGVNANIAANGGTFGATLLDRQGVSGFNRGNPNLNEEKATSYTVGTILNPRSIDALKNLTLRVDYYNINIKDAIVGVPRQFILNKCYEEGDQSFCQFIRRRAVATAVNSAGSLEFIDQAQVNGGALKSEGIDVTLLYSVPVDGVFGIDGNLNFRGTYTRLLTAYTRPVPGEPDRDRTKGEIGAARDRFTTTLGFTSNKFDVNFTGTYIGKSYEDDQTLLSYDLGVKDISVPAQFYLDMQTRFKASDQYEFYVGVDNLTDNKAPNILSGSTFNTTGTDTNAGTYDVFGRRFYAGARLRF